MSGDDTDEPARRPFRFSVEVISRLFRDWLYPAGLADDASLDAAIADFVPDGINANRG